MVTPVFIALAWRPRYARVRLGNVPLRCAGSGFSTVEMVDVEVLALDREGTIILVNKRQLGEHELMLPPGADSFAE